MHSQLFSFKFTTLMTHHEPILISEIRYLDHINWPRFWISAIIWPVTLSVAIMVTTF